MVPGYILLAVFLVFIYSITHENRRSAATASAIRQIWTGSCRLGCRPSYYSDGGASGLSELPGPYTENEPASSTCVCESCPCGLIENFLKCWHPDDIFDFSNLERAIAPPSPEAIAAGCICGYCTCAVSDELYNKTCRPATQIFTSSYETISNYSSIALKRLYDVYNHISRVLECRTACRRNAQLVSPPSFYDSREDFKIVDVPNYEKQLKLAEPECATGSRFGEKYESKVAKPYTKLTGKTSTASADKSVTSSATKLSAKTVSSEYKPTPSSTKSAGRPKSKEEQKPSINAIMAPQTSKIKQIKSKTSEDTLKPATSILDSTRNCTKCVEQGKTCIGGCPTADKKRELYKKKDT